MFEATALTPLKVARMIGYRDWAAQPAQFKRYPDFLFRYAFGSCEALLPVESARFVSSKSTVGLKPYFQLNVPSAGNLHPVELYVQIRGVKGVLSGIYMIDARAKALVLIAEVAQEGLEAHVGLEQNFQGFLYIVSCVGFRSSWKYGLRAFRYCYLDVGHQIGGIEATLKEGQNATILSDFHPRDLDAYMGFSDEEHCCAVIAVGKQRDSPCKPLGVPLMRVAPSDYFEDQEGLVSFLAQQPCFHGEGVQLRSLHVRSDSIKKRRSARSFLKNSMDQKAFEYFMHRLSHPPKPLRSDLVVLDDRFVTSGIYHHEKLCQSGDFAKTVSHLLVDQKFVEDASFVLILSADDFEPEHLMHAGLFAHELALEATVRGCGFSGIGAFYDKKLQKFLSLEKPILYVCALAKGV